jgi:hypothetical protein
LEPDHERAEKQKSAALTKVDMAFSETETTPEQQTEKSFKFQS